MAISYLFGVEGNDNLVYGAIANDPAAPAAFVIVLDETTSGGIVTSASLWIILYTAVTHDGQNVTEGDLVDLTNLVYVASSETETQVFSDFSDVPSGAPIFAMIGSDEAGTGQPGDVQFLVTAFNEEGDPQTVNVSTQGSFPGSLASGSQNTKVGQTLALDTVTGGDVTYTQPESRDANFIDFTDHVEVNRAGFTIVQNQSGDPVLDVTIHAYDLVQEAEDDEGSSFFNTFDTDQEEVVIDDVVVSLIDPVTGQLEELEQGVDYTVSGLGDDEGVVISGLDLNYVVEIVSEEGFERFTVTNTGEGNEQFDIGPLTFSRDIINTDAEEIGSLIQIDDSGPNIDVVAAAPELVVDDSGLPLGTDPGNQVTDSDTVADAFAGTSARIARARSATRSTCPAPRARRPACSTRSPTRASSSARPPQAMSRAISQIPERWRSPSRWMRQRGR